MPISLPLEDTFSAAGGTCDTGQGRIVTGTVGYHLGRAVLSDGAAVAYGPFAPAAGLAAVVHSGAWQTQAVDRFQPSVQGGTSGVVRQAGLALLMEPNGGLGGAVGLNDVASGINQVIPGIDPTGHVHAFALTGKDLITGVVLLGGPPGARAVGGYPDVRPVGVSGYALPADSYLVLNASGGTVEAHDVRIRGDAYADWLGPAHAGQDFRGGSGGLTTDARGLNWAVSGGGTFALGSGGLSNNAQTVRAVVTPASPSGLIAYYVKHLANPVYYRLIFRHQDANNYWYVGVRWDWFLDIGYVSGGVDNQLQTTGANVPGANVERLMQINDDGSKIVVTWAGATIFEIDNATHASARGVGIQMEGDGTAGHTLLQMMLAYPRAVTLPAALRPASVPFDRQGSTLTDEDTFAGPPAHIAGRALTAGGKAWTKNAGAQNVNTDGAGKAVPSAALTTALIYSVPWANPDFIDVEFAWDLNSTYSRGGVLLAQSLTPGAETYLAAAVFRDPSQPGTDEIELRAVVNGAGGGNRIYPVQLGTRMGSVVTGRMTYDRALDRGALWLDGVPVMEFSWRMVSDGSTTPPSVNYWGLYNDQPNNGGAWDYARARAAQQTHALALQSGTLTPSGPSLALSQGHALAPQSGSLSLSAPALSLSQTHALREQPGRLTFSRASVAYHPETGQQVAAGQPRYVAGRYGQGVLVEEGTANLLLRSEEFDSAAWAKTNASVTANAVAAPNGAVRADKLVESAATGTHWLTQQLSKSGSALAYAFSVYAKAGERSRLRLQLRAVANGANGVTAIFDLASGTLVSTALFGSGWPGASGRIEAVGGGWYRCTLVATSDTSTTITPHLALDNGSTDTYAGDGSSGLYLWGAQLEQKGYATSYLPTVGGAATRSAETLSFPTAGVLGPGNGNAWDQGCVALWAYLRQEEMMGGASPRFMTFFRAQGGSAPCFDFYHRPSAPEFFARLNNVQFGWTPPSPLATGWHHFALVWDRNGLGKFFVDGVLRSSANLNGVTLPILSSATLGGDGITGWLNAPLDDVRIYSRALSDAEIAALAGASSAPALSEESLYAALEGNLDYSFVTAIRPQAPALSLSQSHGLAAPSATLTPQAPSATLSQTHGLAFQAAALTPSAPALTLSQTHPLAFHSGTLSFSGSAPALSQTHALAAPAASLGLAGAAIALNLSHALAVTPGVQALTGAALALQQSHSLALAPGVLSLEGTPIAVYSQTLEGSTFRAVPERPRYRAVPERPKYLARKE